MASCFNKVSDDKYFDVGSEVVYQTISGKVGLKNEKSTEEQDEKDWERRTITIPYLKGFSEQVNRIAQKHSFKVVFKPGGKVKEIKSKCQKTLDERQNGVVYRIPCKCEESVYIGETQRLFQTRKREHENKVRLSKEDITCTRLDSAEQRVEKEDGGLARHSAECNEEINWEEAR